MNLTSSRTARSTLAGVVTFFILVYPMLGLGYALVGNPVPEELTSHLLGRSLTLLVRSLLLASAATLLCTLASFPIALAFRNSTGWFVGNVLISMMAATILTPPMIYAFGWQRLLPTGLSPEFRCVLVWTLWAWPIPTWFLASAMSSLDRRAEDAARLETRGFSLVLRIILPQVAPAIAISFLVLLVLFLGDYGVPHAFGMRVFATDLLSQAESSAAPIGVVVASLPGVGVILTALVGVAFVWVRFAQQADSDRSDRTVFEEKRMAFAGLTAAVYFVMSWITPMAGLIPGLAIRDFVQSWVVYGGDFASTLLMAAAAGLVSIFLGLFVLNARRLVHAIIVLSVMWGALPGALVGEALVSAFNRPILGYLYDRWPIMVLSFLLHFGWIGLVTVQLARRTLARDIPAQAALDGATGACYLWRVFLPNTWPTLSVGAGVITVLSMGDVAASTLVRVPSFNPMAHVIIEKFHRLEDGMMIALSLNIIFVVGLLVALIAWAVRPNELHRNPVT